MIAEAGVPVMTLLRDRDTMEEQLTSAGATSADPGEN